MRYPCAALLMFVLLILLLALFLSLIPSLPSTPPPAPSVGACVRACVCVCVCVCVCLRVCVSPTPRPFLLLNHALSSSHPLTTFLRCFYWQGSSQRRGGSGCGVWHMRPHVPNLTRVFLQGSSRNRGACWRGVWRGTSGCNCVKSLRGVSLRIGASAGVVCDARALAADTPPS